MFDFDVRDSGKGELERWRRWVAEEARAARDGSAREAGAGMRGGDGGSGDGAADRND